MARRTLFVIGMMMTGSGGFAPNGDNNLRGRFCEQISELTSSVYDDKYVQDCLRFIVDSMGSIVTEALSGARIQMNLTGGIGDNDVEHVIEMTDLKLSRQQNESKDADEEYEDDYEYMGREDVNRQVNVNLDNKQGANDLQSDIRSFFEGIAVSESVKTRARAAIVSWFERMPAQAISAIEAYLVRSAEQAFGMLVRTPPRKGLVMHQEVNNMGVDIAFEDTTEDVKSKFRSRFTPYLRELERSSGFKSPKRFAIAGLTLMEAIYETLIAQFTSENDPKAAEKPKVVQNIESLDSRADCKKPIESKESNAELDTDDMWEVINVETAPEPLREHAPSYGQEMGKKAYDSVASGFSYALKKARGLLSKLEDTKTVIEPVKTQQHQGVVGVIVHHGENSNPSGDTKQISDVDDTYDGIELLFRSEPRNVAGSDGDGGSATPKVLTRATSGVDDTYDGIELLFRSEEDSEKPNISGVRIGGTRVRRRERVAGEFNAPGVRGLRQLHKSCFVNAVLQALFSSEPVRAALSREFLRVPTNPLVVELRNVFSRFWTSDQLPGGVIDTAPLMEQVWSIDGGNRFARNQPGDAFELFQTVDGALEDVIGDLISGQLLQAASCHECHQSGVRTEPFHTISLPLPVGAQAVPLSALLGNFFAPEEISLDCSECLSATATKNYAFSLAPTVLVIQLKRFQFDQDPTTRAFVSSRNNAPVSIPEHLVLDEENFGVDALYSLTAVIHHHGARLDDGHFKTDALHPTELRWYHRDDAIVYPISGPSTNTTSPYLLFYRLSG